MAKPLLEFDSLRCPGLFFCWIMMISIFAHSDYEEEEEAEDGVEGEATDQPRTERRVLLMRYSFN